MRPVEMTPCSPERWLLWHQFRAAVCERETASIKPNVTDDFQRDAREEDEEGDISGFRDLKVYVDPEPDSNFDRHEFDPEPAPKKSQSSPGK